jgi:Family of unknown function (DUF6527)
MKAKPIKRVDGSYAACPVEEATYIELRMPGPLPYRILPVILSGSRDKHPRHPWTWNGDTEKPTLRPSILSRAKGLRCHTFVTDGKAIFLEDCSHALAGKTIDLLEVE